MKSLFGDTIPDEPAKEKRDYAHAAKPGSGPEGQTCGTCLHRYVAHYHFKNYQKCGLMREHWTHGPGSDIRCKDPACREWRAMR